MSVAMATGTGTAIAEDGTSPSSQDTKVGATQKQADPPVVNDLDLEDDARNPLGMHPDTVHSGDSSRESRAMPQAPRRLYADSDYSFRKPIPRPESREKAASSRPGRGALATWDPPPLSQSYAQAIRHAQLPTCTTPVDTLLRMEGDRHDFDVRELSTSSSTSTDDTGSVSIGETLEKPKRRHRRNTSGSSMKLGWASKIYVLLPAGRLLQYAAEGALDRLPEKFLLLKKDSAAFASDIIPGRHWVLRVCSAMEADSHPAGDSRSLLSRLPFRGSDRSDASTFLMVFESAEDMEGWITTLRREIERLGGTTSPSETGTPKPQRPVAEEQTLPAQQTLATQDPLSFSSRRRESIMTSAGRAHESHHETYLANTLRIHERELHTSDDVSTTNSVYSQDGRQLHNIRDSSHSHISSGQRTMLTSGTGTSPPCSPARDSFASSPSKMPHASVSPMDRTSDDPSSAHSADAHLPRQQPHAALLLRDVHSDQLDHHPQFPLTAQPPILTSPAVPNFSVPHSSRRFSGGLRSPSSDTTLSPAPSNSPPSGPPQEMKKPHYSPFPAGARKNTRKPPPPALVHSRPLSVVPDQPSCETPADLSDESNVSSVCHSSQAYEAPRVPWTGSDRASTSSQHSGSSDGAKSRGSIKDRLTSGSGTKGGFAEKTTKKRGGIQALRTSLATKIANAVMSDGMSLGAPYSAALPMPISQIPVQYRPQLLLQKAASAAAKTKETETPSRAHEVSLKAKVDEPTRETGAVEGTVHTPTSASASLMQTAEFDEEVVLSGLPPQRPQVQPMPPMPPPPLPHGQPYIPHQALAQPQASSYTSARPNHARPWDDMARRRPVHRPPITYHPTSPAGGVVSPMAIDAGVDRDRGRVPPRHSGHPASRPTTPRTPGRSGHSLARSVSSQAPEDRHSMPQAIIGPPPAPPPTCALPPLPLKVAKLDVQRQSLHA